MSMKLGRRYRKERERKAKQKVQRELLRKPKYLREIRRVLPIFLIIMLLFDCWFTESAANSYQNMAYDSMEAGENRLKNVVDSINEKYEALDFNEVDCSNGVVYAKEGESKDVIDNELGKLAWQASLPDFADPRTVFDNIYYGYKIAKRGDPRDLTIAGYHLALFNTNGDLLMQSEENIFQMVTVKDEEGKTKNSFFYRLDNELLEKYHPDFYEIVAKNVIPMNNNYALVDVYFDDLYVKGSYVLPKTVEFRNVGTTNRFGEVLVENDDDYTVVETIDLSDCDFSGYEQLVPEDNTKFWIPIYMENSAQSSNHAKLFSQLTKEDIKRNIKTVTGVDNYSQEYEVEETRMWGSSWELTKNDTLVQVVTFDYDFYRDWKPILAIIYSFALFVAIVISLVVARIRYGKKKILYEVDHYRRKTTDAMAHDLKSPLMAISGYAEMLMVNKDSDKVLEYSENIQNSVKDMDRMIANILQLAKTEESDMKLDRKEVSMATLIGEVLATYESKVELRGLIVNVEGDTKLHADEMWMKHLIDNLVSNAVKYSTEGSAIDILISKSELRIQNKFDYDMDVAPQALLDAFVKGDKARNNTEGNGLGLGIANNIAIAHGYSLELKTEGQEFQAILHF